MLFLVGGGVLLVVDDAGSRVASLEVEYHVGAFLKHKTDDGQSRHVLFRVGWDVEGQVVVYVADIGPTTVGQFLGDALLQGTHGFFCQLVEISLCQCGVGNDTE